MKLIKFIFTVAVVLGGITTSYSQTAEEAKKYEVKIIERLIIDTVKDQNPRIYVYSESKRKQKEFANKIRKYSKKLKIVDNVEISEFVLVLDTSRYLEFSVPSLALSFSAVEKCDSCIGVFSWKNGRPSLILFEEKLNKMRILLPKEYSYFIE